MTPMQLKVLEHLVDVATGRKWNIPPQKRTAWDMAHNYALLDPDQLSEMPAMLTTAMLSQKPESSTLPAPMQPSAASTAKVSK